MPELPEVETIKNDLSKRILDLKILGADILLPRIVKNNARGFRRALTGNRFSAIRRVGKLMVFELEGGGKHLLVHLKMTGQLVYRKGERLVVGGHSQDSPVDMLPNKYTRVIIKFSNGSYLFFNDMRTFGYMKLVCREELNLILARFGVEPISKEFSLKRFKDILTGRTTSIKALLLNQNLIAGLGNIYVDEALFLSGVRPNRRVNSLSELEIKKIFKYSRVVLEKGIKYRGTTFNNYVDASGRRGGYLKHLKVYGRGGKKCLKCRTGIIKKMKVAGRGTSYCPGCQN